MMDTLTFTDRNQYPTTATIGFFDGVHTGHRFLIQQVKREAAAHNEKSMIITFTNHPRLLLDPDCGLKQLTLVDERIKLLDDTNIDYTLLIDFNKQIASLTSTQFMDLMKRQFSIHTLVIGYDHHFGSDRTSTFEQYKTYGNRIGINVVQAAGYKEQDTNVSSSKIRKALNDHDIRTANLYLGHDYTISGTVIPGKQIGRTIQYPTANIAVNPLKLLPAGGVYAAKTIIDNTAYRAMVNIGTRPTLSGTDTTIEAHILDFSQNLYNKDITIQFVDYIRPEQKFNSLEHLRQQLITDQQTTIRLVNL